MSGNSLQFGKSQVLFVEWQSFQPTDHQPHMSLNLYSELPHVLVDKDYASVLNSMNVVGSFVLVFLSPAL